MDAGLNYDAPMISAELDLFYNVIDDFIYNRNSNNEMTAVDNVNYPVYRYTQGKSALQGFEFSLDLHPFESLHFENSASWVKGKNLDIKQPLPYMPAFHFRNEIKLNPSVGKKSALKEPFITIGLDNSLQQDDVDPFETPTRGYSLLYAGIGTDLVLMNQNVRFYIMGENLLDKEYVSHLNRLKEYGIHNQGRNITFGLNIKFAGRMSANSK
jgi:iron complex outermembrane recepter protein